MCLAVLDALYDSKARSLGGTWRGEPGNTGTWWDVERDRRRTGEHASNTRHRQWKPSNQRCSEPAQWPACKDPLYLDAGQMSAQEEVECRTGGTGA